MIALAQRPPSTPSPSSCHAERRHLCHHEFLTLLPAIRGHARLSFRHLREEARQEAVASAVAHAWMAFRRLVELGRTELIYATPLARYSVARVRDGRRVGSRTNRGDVLSAYCQRRNGLRVESLHHDEGHDQWRQIIAEDRKSGPAQTAIARLDFEAWLSCLPAREREIATVLATGESTHSTAKRFAVTPGRISQLRRRLYALWLKFQGELAASGPQPT